MKRLILALFMAFSITLLYSQTTSNVSPQPSQIAVKKVMAEYWGKLKENGAKKQTLSDRKAADKALYAEYEAKLSAIVGPEKASAIINARLNAIKARGADIKRLELDKPTALEVAQLIRSRDEALDKIRTDPNLIYNQKISKVKIVRTQFLEDLWNTIGEEKFALWKKESDAKRPTRFKTKLKLTDEQMEGYKSCVNKKYVAINMVKRMNLPKDQQLEKINAIQDRYKKGLQQIFTPEQYQKFMDMQKQQARHIKNIKARSAKKS